MDRRLGFIEARLFWLGEVNRAHLVDRFGVSMSQASGDIAKYLAINGKGVDYDRSAKRYFATASFGPVRGEPDANRFLGELRLVEAGLMRPEDTLIGFAPPFAATPVPERKIDDLVLRAVFQGIRNASAVEATYQSMSRPRPIKRTIEPHALAFDGFRWHARAYDRETETFRDFVLGRLSKARIDEGAVSDPASDTDWHTFVDLDIAPHPKLSGAQARAIAMDYGITRGSVRIPVRRALLFYALKRLGLDHDPDTRPPNVQQIVLRNRADVQPWLEAVLT
ncbi:MAG: WYL domain-containing protein [Alphaproteobacteria bacterium]